MRGGTRRRGDTWTWYFDAVDPVTGKRRQRSKGGFRTKREALAAYRAGTLVEASRLTIGMFQDEWLPTMAGNLEPKTQEVYWHYARTYIKPRVGHVRLQQLTTTNLRALYTELAATGGRRGQGLKPKTVKNAHTLIHRALEDAVDRGLVSRNVAALRSARPPKLERVERAVWSPQDLRSFLRAMEADRLAALWLLLATTGLRRSRSARPALASDRLGERPTDRRPEAGNDRQQAGDPAGHEVPGRAAVDRTRPGHRGSAPGPP